MKLTKHDRPSSVPTRISRFTMKAPNKWRTGDTSAFEYDKPRIKRSGNSGSRGGSQKTNRSATTNIYPDWWGDGSAASSRSPSRNRKTTTDDDNARRTTTQPRQPKAPKQGPNIHKYIAHPSDETRPQNETSTDGINQDEIVEEYTAEQESESRESQQTPPEKPVVPAKQKKGTIYSKLHNQTQAVPKNDVPVKSKSSKNGYAMTFSPTQNKKKSKKKQKSNQENIPVNQSSSFQYSYLQNQDADSDPQEPPRKMYVRQSDQYKKYKKPHKGKSMREINSSNKQKALESRERLTHARQTHNHENPNNTQGKRKIPKSLQHVGSVIKDRIEYDKEMNRRKKQVQLNNNKEPEIYAPNVNVDASYESQSSHKKDRNSRSRSKSDSKNRQSRSFTNNDRSMEQQTYQNQPQESQEDPRNQRPTTTEGSSYPSVTQASAPPQDYYRNDNMRAEYQPREYQPREYQPRDYQRTEPYKQPQSYRPSSIGGQNQNRENNVVDITEGFLNSPMMTQFSDTSEPKRRPYRNNFVREEERKEGEEKDNSGYQNSSYAQYAQNRSNESMYGNMNPYENQQNYNQHSSVKNPMSNPVSNSNGNYSRFYDDQVLFKSNGFEGNATSSGKANDSAMLQSPNVQNNPKDNLNSDSKLTGTANFERPREYDAKYSDYRRDNSRDRAYGDNQPREENKDSQMNPFKTRDYTYNPSMISSSGQPFGHNPPYDYQNRNLGHQAPGSYKYLPKWEGGDAQNINSSGSYMADMSQNRGPPKYLEPHEESKYYSQSDEGEEFESDYTEGEESDSEYDSEISRTEDYRSNSSLSNYTVPEYAQNRPMPNYPPGSMEGGHRVNPQFYNPAQSQDNMFQSIPGQSDKNPQLMSSIGSDYSGMVPPQYQQQPMHREMPQNPSNPYGMYQNYQ